MVVSIRWKPPPDGSVSVAAVPASSRIKFAYLGAVASNTRPDLRSRILLTAALESAPEVLGLRALRLRGLARGVADVFQSLASGLALPFAGANALGNSADQPPGASRPRQTPHSKLSHTSGP